jgi:hypothetical protein
MQRHDLQLRIEIDLAVVLGHLSVRDGLAVLADHDDWRLQGHEHRQQQIQENERIWSERGVSEPGMAGSCGPPVSGSLSRVHPIVCIEEVASAGK